MIGPAFVVECDAKASPNCYCSCLPMCSEGGAVRIAQEKRWRVEMDNGKPTRATCPACLRFEWDRQQGEPK